MNDEIQNKLTYYKNMDRFFGYLGPIWLYKLAILMLAVCALVDFQRESAIIGMVAMAMVILQRKHVKEVIRLIEVFQTCEDDAPGISDQ